MKSLFVTVLLFCLTLCATVGNYHYINSTAEHMHALIEELPSPDDDACPDAITSLEEEWQSHAPRIGLTVEFRTLDRVTEQLALLYECACHGDVFGYYNALALLRDAIDDMRRLECLSVSNIF
ncbi:MAG: DUF4363 family protein [Clostridia bacterium]|nr:DUF4363 family protein [Clostridia bacterium]